MRVAEKVYKQHEEDIERELAAWRLDVRLHALAQLARKPAKPARSVRIGVFVMLLFFLTGLLIELREAMRLKILPDETPIEVFLVDEAPVEPALPVPAPGRSASAPKAMDGREGPHTTAVRRIEPPPTAVQATAAEPEPVPNYRVFNPDGSVIIPPAGANQGMQASFVPQSTAASPLMHHQRPLKVRPNHFAGNWQAPDGETIVGAFVREHLTSDTAEFMTPWGTLVKCRVVAVMGGCTWGPPPARESRPTWQPASVLDEQ